MYKSLQFKIKSAPPKPGVYIFKNKKDQVIYVGKAKNISKRVASYFARPSDGKTARLVLKIADLDFIITDNEVEALILENSLIKKHRPTYNIDFKDDKSYPYLEITLQDTYPRVMITREAHKKGAKYYGPYTDVKALRYTLDTLRHIFPVRTCKTIKPGKKSGYPCLNYHIERCLGPCSGKVSPPEYRKIIEAIVDFLEGKGERVTRSLTNQMSLAAKNLEFERAARVRNRIEAAKRILDKQKMVSENLENQDIIGLAFDDDLLAVEIFNVRGGKMVASQDFFLKKGVEEDTLASFLKQYYSRAGFVPREIILPEAIEDHQLLEKWLGNLSSTRVKMTIPSRGKKRRLVGLANRNAAHYLEMSKKRLNVEAQRALEMLKELSDLMRGPLPSRLECFDISTIQGSDSVGSMVVFIEGKPYKDHYRRFRIRHVKGQNDFEMMKEVLDRRVRNLLEGRKKSFKEKPDLILVDGGQSQLSAARQVLEAYKLDIPVAGLAKKREELYLPEKSPLVLLPGSRLLHLVQQLRDEAHRFAVSYHRRLRSKRLSVSALDGIIGLGTKRKQLLIKKFGSPSTIRNLSVDELAEVPGIGRKTAQVILSNLRT